MTAQNLVGATLPGGWQVHRHIAEGAMGHVYEARGAGGSPARVAVKVLHTSLVGKPDVAFRFRHEAELVEAVSSPHVPKLLARGRDQRGRPFQVLEFVEGVELNALLSERVTLPYMHALEIAIQMCRALAAAHAAGIVHRDMKPENVIVQGYPDDLMVKVLDFSVSKEENLAFTQTGVVLGTPSYMPPEQALGDVTPLVDVYAAGAILYDMLLGRPPFEGDEPGKVLATLLTQEPPKPRELAPHLSLAAEAVLLRATARKPAERYQSVTELMDALVKLQSEASRQSIISTIPPPPPALAAPSEARSLDVTASSGTDRQRTRYLIPAAIVTLMIVLAVVALAMWR